MAKTAEQATPTVGSVLCGQPFRTAKGMTEYVKNAAGLLCEIVRIDRPEKRIVVRPAGALDLALPIRRHLGSFGGFEIIDETAATSPAQAPGDAIASKLPWDPRD